MSQPQQDSPATGMARAASLIALGNILSRLLGLGRETVIAGLFGATGLVSAFRVAQIIPVMLYDLLVGGMVSSALVPVFSEQAEKDRAELWRIASLILSLVTILMAGVVLLIEWTAPQIAWLMAGGFDEALLAETTRLIRLTTPAVLFLSLSGVITGLLQALKRFTLPAFTASVFNATIVAVAMLGATVFQWGIDSLAIGLLLGAFLQVALQLPGLRDARLRFSFNLRHPALWRILKLGLPIILGLVISQIAIALDRNLASRTGEQSIAWMGYATTIIQFPLGLISAAISLAILPTLSRQAAAAQPDLRPFVATLTAGLRMVLVLIIPAAVALFVLAEPIVTLLFQRGHFTPLDTGQTALALRFYLLGLCFAAIDQPLVFAYYARQNTLTPALVGLLGVGFYAAAALLPALFRPLRMTDLVLANSLQLTGHPGDDLAGQSHHLLARPRPGHHHPQGAGRGNGDGAGVEPRPPLAAKLAGRSHPAGQNCHPGDFGGGGRRRLWAGRVAAQSAGNRPTTQPGPAFPARPLWIAPGHFSKSKFRLTRPWLCVMML
jgi:putative peptidoglycan lipid II flippase